MINVIIPMCGKGERFSKQGFKEPKALLEIYEKRMIDYVLDNLSFESGDNLIFIYLSCFNEYHFKEHILHKNLVPSVFFVDLAESTKGAAETIKLGIEKFRDLYPDVRLHQKTLLCDCDTFYTENIIQKFKDTSSGAVFYTENTDANPIYSYIKFEKSSGSRSPKENGAVGFANWSRDAKHCGAESKRFWSRSPKENGAVGFANWSPLENKIVEVAEKVKISDNANTGAYGFHDIDQLYKYCQKVIDQEIFSRGEPYMSCVISEMIKDGHDFQGIELDSAYVHSLGTPEAVKKYIEKTLVFCFDLDGTIVLTDEIYLQVWKEILSPLNIDVDYEFFKTFIQGNNDRYVTDALNITNISLKELSELKDALFLKHLEKIRLIEGFREFITELSLHGNKKCIVTNCNRVTAIEILKYLDLIQYFDFIISSNDVQRGKPNVEPYAKALARYQVNKHPSLFQTKSKVVIFEDSKTGIMSGLGVQPNLLVGIQSLYDSSEMARYGVLHSFKNYEPLRLSFLENIIHSAGSKIYDDLVRSINVKTKQILIDDNLLKGGFIASVSKVDIVYTDDTKQSLVFKYESENENNLLTMAKNLELYDREYYFYTHISKYIDFIKFPKYISIVKDTDGKNIGILLENLSHLQLNLNLNIESIDVTLKIVDRMAKLHSFFWNVNLNQKFPQLKNSTDFQFFSDFVRAKYPSFKSKWFTIFSEKNKQLCDSIINSFHEIQQYFSQGNLTLIHGDIKSPNIFYDVNENYEPYFIDWQHIAIGKGVQDLVFFILESHSIENLLFIFNLAKSYYFKKLAEYGVKNYTIQEYNLDLLNAVKYVPFFTLIWFGSLAQDELIDKNFPYFLITKTFLLLNDLIQNTH